MVTDSPLDPSAFNVDERVDSLACQLCAQQREVHIADLVDQVGSRTAVEQVVAPTPVKGVGISLAIVPVSAGSSTEPVTATAAA